MHRFSCAHVLLALFVCCSALPTQSEELLERPRSSTNQFSFVDQIVQQHIDDGKLVGAVTWIAQNGKVIHLQAHGWRDRESGSEMQRDSIFRIYSFTKSIATAAALMLWEEGKFELDDPVERYLPAFRDQLVYDPTGNREPKRAMTVRDLMTHTSGIISPASWGSDLEKKWDDAELRDIDVSLEEFSSKVAALPLEFSPGERWKYGMSIDVLAHLIEVWSGRKFEEFLHDRIFDPLRLSDTDFYVPEEKLARLATLYERDKEGQLAARDGKQKDKPFYVPTTSPIRCSGGGGLYSTASDYGTFLQMILAGGRHDELQLLKPETIGLMTSDQLPDHIAGIQFGNEVRDGFKFGLGFNVITKPGKWDPQARVGEYGWGGAASCHYWLWPPQQLAVITLEATWPYNRHLEDALKAKIYDFLD
ncbi:MAG: serine hydrolase domain-containing protein [Planctomycetota bacterium]